ncbi:MAG: hypothetical protein AB7F75_04310 [Planctomycetota bacterium]
MVTFVYEAVDTLNRTRKGDIKASHREEAIASLRDSGLHPLAIFRESECGAIRSATTALIRSETDHFLGWRLH